jgi:hypothetical protein
MQTNSIDENEFEDEGKTYVAKDAGVDLSCDGCALDHPAACFHSKRPKCTGTFRKDQRNVIFIEKTA